MWRPLQLGLVVVCLLVGTLSATETEIELIQPTPSRSNIVLQSSRGSARVEREGARPQTVPLRSDEILTTIAETRDGWTAAGLEEHEQGTELLVIRRNGQGIRRISSRHGPSHQRQLLLDRSHHDP